MSANLLIALVVVGIIAAGAIHWLFKGGGRARPGRRKTKRSGSPVADKSEPALSAIEEFGSQDEIPLLEVPDEAPDEAPPGSVPAGRGVPGVHGDRAAGPHQGVAEKPAARAFNGGAGAAADSPASAPAGAPARAQPQPGGLPPFGAQPGRFHRRAIEGFERLSQIDFWAKVTGTRDVGRETVLAIYHDGAAGLTKPHSIHGLKVPEKAWCNLEDETEDSRFADLVVTVQLADSSGAISDTEMTRFSNLVSKLSEGTGREFQFMTTTENAFAQAAAIAEFAEHFDSVFVVNISPNPGQQQGSGRFQGAAIDRYAPGMGLERDGNQYYSRFKQVGKGRVRLYSLANRSETGRFDFHDMQSFSSHGLVFFTKPAVNRSPGAVFAEMVDTAKAFAARIQGVVDSPNHGDLSQEEVESIRRSIEQVAAEMERAGIAAGSDEAARLFA